VDRRLLRPRPESKGIGLTQQQSTTIILEVKIPDDASPGNYSFTVNAEGTYSIAKKNFSITVESVPQEINLYSQLDWQVAYPEENLTFSLQVSNLGFFRDNYILYVDNPPLPENWTAYFYIGNRRLRAFSADPQETVNVILTIGVPEDATPGDYQFRVNIDGKYFSASQGLMVTIESIPSPSRKISILSPFQSQTILAGKTTYYPIQVANEGGKTENIFLIVNTSSNMRTWAVSFSERELTLGPKESVWVTLDVKPPGVAEEGKYYMNITAITEDRELEKTLQITTTIVGDYLLEVTGVQPINPQVYQGEKIDVIVTVRNLGQSPLTMVRLNINSTAIPNVLVTPLELLALEPMASIDFFVRVSPDTNLTPGDYIISVQAESNETKSSVRAFAVNIASPIPWFWITIGIAVIATALTVIAIQKAASKWGLKLRVRRR